MSTDRNWAHRPEFDAVGMQEFENRLRRARAASRAGYLRVKAATLLDQQDRAALPVAIELLERVVTEYDHFLEVSPMSFWGAPTGALATWHARKHT